MKFEDDIQNLLDDSKVVTYRNLSSLLDVHVNISKKMLYTFYQQNQDKLCAVYLICGKMNLADFGHCVLIVVCVKTCVRTITQ